MLAAQGIATRRHRHRRRRRHGVDEQLPVSAAARARGLAHGRRHDRRLDDPRRAVGFVPQHPHGPDRRARVRDVPRHARGTGPVRRREPSARPRRRRAQGWFKDEILPVSIPQKKGDPIVIDRDESIRDDTTVESLGRLKPAFKKDGTVTAGNAPGVNDGAAALVVMGGRRGRQLGLTPLARVVGYATSGLEPKLVMMTPVEAVKKLLQKTGWAIGDVDLRRAERGVRGAGRGGHARTRSRSGARQRARRRRGARPPDRRERRARADDAALRAEAAAARSVASRRSVSAAATAWRWQWRLL